MPGGVGGHVGPRLVDHPDHAERHPHLAQLQPVGQGAAPHHLADRVGQPGHLAQPLRHAGEPVRGRAGAGRRCWRACRPPRRGRRPRRWRPAPRRAARAARRPSRRSARPSARGWPGPGRSSPRGRVRRWPLTSVLDVHPTSVVRTARAAAVRLADKLHPPAGNQNLVSTRHTEQGEPAPRLSLGRTARDETHPPLGRRGHGRPRPARSRRGLRRRQRRARHPLPRRSRRGARSPPPLVEVYSYGGRVYDVLGLRLVATDEAFELWSTRAVVRRADPHRVALQRRHHVALPAGHDEAASPGPAAVLPDDRSRTPDGNVVYDKTTRHVPQRRQPSGCVPTHRPGRRTRGAARTTRTPSARCMGIQAGWSVPLLEPGNGRCSCQPGRYR